jgi:hypothetical protein
LSFATFIIRLVAWKTFLLAEVALHLLKARAHGIMIIGLGRHPTTFLTHVLDGAYEV